MLPALQETQVQSLGPEDALEKGLGIPTPASLPGECSLCLPSLSVSPAPVLGRPLHRKRPFATSWGLREEERPPPGPTYSNSTLVFDAWASAHLSQFIMFLSFCQAVKAVKSLRKETKQKPARVLFIFLRGKGAPIDPGFLRRSWPSEERVQTAECLLGS